MIIYPPLIGDIIPAFTTEIKIPFQHNPAVNMYSGIALKIIDFANNSDIGDVIKTEGKNISSPVSFERPEELVKGRYYKFQIAYYDDDLDTKLSFSNIAVGKYVEAGSKISISNLNLNEINYNIKIYKGNYIAADSEPAYQYRFQFFDENEKIIQDTGLLLATNEMVCELKNSLEEGIIYAVKFTVITVNGLEETVSYKFIKAGELPNSFIGEVITSSNSEDGCVEITLSGEAINSEFRLYRSTDKQIWDIFVDSIIMLEGEDLTTDYFKWRDYTVEQGQTYYYGLSQISNDTISMKKISSGVVADFEDIFLSDGEKQLKIRFNPKVSSFKETLLENKIDTIGSKYPFFSRNARVGYKEFSISGLISYQMDNNQLFMTDEDLGLSTFSQSNEGAAAANFKYRTTDLVDYNYTAERKFKLAVLDWLNNGKPKLYRSPTEGNYVIRLMGVSLTPNETLGGLIHTFSSTAYECDNSDYEGLKKNNLFNNNIKEKFFPSFVSYAMADQSEDLIIEGPTNNISIDNSFPSTDSYFNYNENKHYIYGTHYFISFINEGENITIPNISANKQIIITYEQSNGNNVAIATANEFETRLINSEDSYQTYKTEDAIPKYIYIYYLSITAETDSEIDIGNNTIKFLAGQTKAFSNIDGNIFIGVKEGQMTITIHGRKEIDNVV